MKFVCDKCKTRYSIGEDRVRGKILKIRCKNCSNVITVREGMDAGDDAAAPAERRSRPTTAAPAIGIGNAKPAPPAPPALQQEWYVSIDGVQTGPLSLTEAQKWVGAKPFEADLHCWSEGFDDWLSVDKVSHFRNLRKPRAPTPTPAPRTERPKTVPPPIPPQPLFAATMAAIEKEASGAHRIPAGAAKTSSPALPKPGLPGPRANGSGSGPTPLSAKGGSGSVPAMPGNGSGAMPALPGTGSGSVPAIPGKSGVPAIPGRTSSPSGRFNAQKSASHAALAAAFDPDEEPDSRTQMEAPPFDDLARAPAKPDPFASKADPFDLGGRNEAPNDPFFAAKPEAAKPTVKQALESDEDDGLSIGEVSRVVKLADLAPKPRAATAAPVGNNTGAVNRLSQTGMQPRINQTASVPRIGAGTQSLPKLSPDQLGMNVDPSFLAQGPAPDESIVAQTFRQKHRRGMIALLAFAGILVAGVIGVLIYITSGQTEETGGGLGGGTKTIDTSRPEDLVRRQLPQPPETGSGSATVSTRPKYTGTRPNTGTNNPPPVEDDPKGLSLKASEIEEMAAKQGEGTKRCYMRAQKGAMGFEIADVKKIAVTLSVAKDGTVSTVTLDSHGNDSFGQCLIARIKAWKFRESPNGGTFRISLAFSS